MKKNNLSELISEYEESDPARFHMPGHGAAPISSPLDSVFRRDVTETPLTDDLLSPRSGGAIEKDEREIAALYMANAAIISASGATLALQTACLAAIRKTGKKKFAVHLGAHSSVIYALSLLDSPIVFFNDSGSASLFEDCAGVIITTPDYYGKIYDSDKLADTVSGSGAILITDASHGAHLQYIAPDLLPKAGLRIDSLHKTCPALTGAALLLDYTGCFDFSDLRSAMKIFSSTSPSYIIVSSAIEAVKYMSENGKEKLENLISRLDRLKKNLLQAGYGIYSPEKSDPARLTLESENAVGIFDSLIKMSPPIVPEFCDAEHIVFLFPVNTGESDFKRLENALLSFPHKKPAKKAAFGLLKTDASYAMTMKAAILKDNCLIPVKDSAGKVAAECASPYPPGIPVVIPGQIITNEDIATLLAGGVERIRVIKESNPE